MPNLFLTGYENQNINQFLQKLSIEGISIVIDVREIPLSRKKGFSKNQLKNALAEMGIEYNHISELGSPSIMRHALRAGRTDYLEFFKKYRLYIKNKKQLFKEVSEVIAKNSRSAILCYEENTELCHRTILASELLKRNRNMKV